MSNLDLSDAGMLVGIGDACHGWCDLELQLLIRCAAACTTSQYVLKTERLCWAIMAALHRACGLARGKLQTKFRK